MDYSPDPATTDMTDVAAELVTFGDLCYAIEKGRVSTERRGSSYELRLQDVRKWRRQEESLRVMLAPLADSLALDLGGLS
ncbi:MAG TPA: hypothetical protein VE338_20170 [Ktedonobacterales bacterium]|jgi:hypothetical protein|nr:hypothetical protein [Ktedonobacterales bacterium]